MITLDFSIKNEYITIMDDDGQVTIQMRKDDVTNVVNAFDRFIQLKEDSSQTIDISNGILDLNLEFYENEFSINGRISDKSDTDSSYFHDFELESIDIKTWNEIVSFINNN